MSIKQFEIREEPDPEKEETSRKTKRSGAGCIVFLAMITFFAICVPRIFNENSDPTNLIEDNLSAATLIHVGMSERDVLEMMRKPTSPWSVLYLKNQDQPVTREVLKVSKDGVEFNLTPVDAQIEDSPYYAYIFYPIANSESQPTFVYFERSNERVFHVGRVNCKQTLAVLDLGNHQTGVPEESGCQAETP